MFNKSEDIKKINQRITGGLSRGVHHDKPTAQVDEANQDCAFKYPDGLTAKQRQNLKKKMKRKAKKAKETETNGDEEDKE